MPEKRSKQKSSTKKQSRKKSTKLSNFSIWSATEPALKFPTRPETYTRGRQCVRILGVLWLGTRRKAVGIARATARDLILTAGP
jgi:hypothetical protein